MTSDTETGMQRCCALVSGVAQQIVPTQKEIPWTKPCGEPVMVIDGELKHVTLDCQAWEGGLPAEPPYDGLCHEPPDSPEHADPGGLHAFKPLVVERGHVPEVR